MKLLRSLLLLWPLLVAPSQACAQEALVRRADRLFGEYRFAEAIDTYERAFAAGAQDLEAARRLASSYRNVRDLASSRKWYELIVNGPDAEPRDLYDYADALRASGAYEQADSVMHIYAELQPMDQRAERQSHTAELRPWLLVDPLFDGELTPFPHNSEWMDMAPTFWRDRLVFASARAHGVGVRRNHAWDNAPFLNLFLVNDSAVRPLKGEVNTRFHESNATFSRDGLEMYFTRNNFLDGHSERGEDGFNNLMIYRSILVDGTWSVESAFPYNDASFSTGHPSLSADGSTLYFSSNRPGGLGGVDLWKCERLPGGEWQRPVNLGPTVNTEGDELFPNIHGDHALFFASDGHAGLGGLDVFLAWCYNGSVMEPQNVGAPVNSALDDMSLVLDRTGKVGYFSSDRNGGLGGADIHRILLDPAFRQQVHIAGRVLSLETNEPMAYMPVRLQTLDRKIVARTMTAANGTFEFMADPQPMTVNTGMSGGPEMEMPLDPETLLLEDPDLVLPDFRISSLVAPSLWVRVVDSNSGHPAPAVRVRILDRAGRTERSDTVTNAIGLAKATLGACPLASRLELDIELSSPAGATVVHPYLLEVNDTDDRVVQLSYNALERLMGPSHDRLAGMYTFMEDSAQEGRTWCGRVIDAHDKLQLAHVPVVLLDMHRTELTRTITDAQGRYVLRHTGVPAFVQASIPGGDSAELTDISPFGEPDLADLELQGVMDLPVNAFIKDAVTEQGLPGVSITVLDTRTQLILFHGLTDANGISKGAIPDMRFGSDENIRITFEKEGYVSRSVLVDFSVLTFLEQALNEPGGARLTPTLIGMDIAKAMHLRPIFFDYNDARIRNDAKADLDLVAEVMRIQSDLTIELRSHTDSRGGSAFNQFLSVRRAESTKAYLISQGVATERLRSVGMGERTPLNGCIDGTSCSEVQHQENRRTEFVVVDSSPLGLTDTGKR
ncbi:MAG TPA: OmpA family protein [Flavobacteriales bacterium]